MSDDTSATIREARGDWAAQHRDRYLASGGADGHIEDLTAVGGHPFATHCLIKYTGRKSGKVFITGLCYSFIAGEVMICASKGGADHHPAWYLNLREAETVEFQIGCEAFRGTMREPQGAERDKCWAVMVDNFPFYASYQASTDRVIPLVLMKAQERIPVLKAEDATGLRPS